jgi:hypothetical protein
MGPEDFTVAEGERDSCIVCQKPVRYGTGFAHIKEDGKMVTLCCPLCMETFQRNPQLYLLRLRARIMESPRGRS